MFRVGFGKTVRALGFWERALVSLLSFIAMVALLYWVGALYLANTKEVPEAGGVYTEGVAGQPRYVNPILSQTSDADADLVNT